MIDFGNAFASIVEKTNDGVGSVAAFEAVASFVFSVVHVYLFTPIVALSGLWKPEQVRSYALGDYLYKYEIIKPRM